MKFDFSMMWNDSVTLLSQHREPVLLFAALFIFLPQVAIGLLLPFAPDTQTLAGFVAAFREYTEEAGAWPLVASLISLLGSLLIFDRLAGPGGRAVGASFPAAARVYLAFVVASIVTGIAVLFGLLLLIIPGLWLSARLLLIGPVIAGQQSRRPFGAMAESWRLTRGIGWSLTLMLAIIYIVYFVIAQSAGLLVGTLVGLINGEAGGTAFIIVSAAMGTMLTVVLAALATAVWQNRAGLTQSV